MRSMLISNANNTRFGQYDGFSTSLLVGEENAHSSEISIQITDVLPGKMQTIHKHPQAQCYYIIEGLGRMIIGDEEANVSKGDAVFIPGNELHGIKNRGESILKYLTANQGFGEQKENEIWFSKCLMQGNKQNNTEKTKEIAPES
jgi:mannose-6-phosphate isomerase-like protein (cupin superfamily)